MYYSPWLTKADLENKQKRQHSILSRFAPIVYWQMIRSFLELWIRSTFRWGSTGTKCCINKQITKKYFLDLDNDGKVENYCKGKYLPSWIEKQKWNDLRFHWFFCSLSFVMMFTVWPDLKTRKRPASRPYKKWSI